MLDDRWQQRHHSEHGEGVLMLLFFSYSFIFSCTRWYIFSLLYFLFLSIVDGIPQWSIYLYLLYL